MTAFRSKADIKLNLGKRSANDPKRTFKFSCRSPITPCRISLKELADSIAHPNTPSFTPLTSPLSPQVMSRDTCLTHRNTKTR